MTLPENAAYGVAFAQQRPILTPIGELLPVEVACVTGFPSCRINHAEHSAELAATRPPPIRLRRTPPKRGNDSLHFARRYRSFKMCSLCIHGKASHVIFGSLSLPYKSRSLATLFRGENRPLYAFL